MTYENNNCQISQIVNTGGWLEVVNYSNWVRFWSSIPEELRLYSFRFWLGFFHHQNIPRDHHISHL